MAVMTDEKIIEVMENMKFHADRTDDKELKDVCDGAIKAIKDNAKLKEAMGKIKEDIENMKGVGYVRDPEGFVEDEIVSKTDVESIIDTYTEGLI